MMRAEPTNNRTEGIDTFHSTMITLLQDLNVIYFLFICLWADTKSIVRTHTLCSTQVDTNRQNRT